MLKVETTLLVLPRTMHQCKIQYGNTTEVKSVLLTTPKHHKLLEQSCDNSGEEVAYALDATQILASISSLPWRIFTFAFFLYTKHTMAKPSRTSSSLKSCYSSRVYNISTKYLLGWGSVGEKAVLKCTKAFLKLHKSNGACAGCISSVSLTGLVNGSTNISVTTPQQ